MNLSLIQKTESMDRVHRPHFKKESLSQRIYLLERSIDRYGYLQEHGALDVLVDAEINLIRSRLLSIRTELAK